MTAGAQPDSPGYSYASVSEILQISESKLRYWAQSGLVGPSLRRMGQAMFSFRDLVSVKATKELTDRGFKAVEIRKALAVARATLPTLDRPLDRLRVAFDGETLVMVDEGAAFELTGQRVFAFGLAELADRARRIDDDGVHATPLRGTPPAPTQAVMSAYDSFVEGLRLSAEPDRAAEAIVAYERAIKIDPGLAAARTNLGTLLFKQGDAAAARAAFEAALDLDPDQAEARYNLANLLLAEGRTELAAAEFRHVLQLVPDFADAHYNLATALERLGGKTQAREHLERYLTLADASADDPWVREARERLQRLEV